MSKCTGNGLKLNLYVDSRFYCGRLTSFAGSVIFDNGEIGGTLYHSRVTLSGKKLKVVPRNTNDRPFNLAFENFTYPAENVQASGVVIGEPVTLTCRNSEYSVTCD